MKTKNIVLKLLFVLSILAGLVAIAWSILAVLCSTAITFGMVLPVIAGFALIAFAVLRLSRPGPVIKNKVLRRFVVACVGLGLVAVLFFEALMLSALAVPKSDEEPDVVLVLGCGIFADGGLTYSLQSRLDAAYDALQQYENAMCIVSGGQGENEPMSEAQAMRDYLILRGVGKTRILMEAKSRNTAENMRFSAEIMQQYGLKTAAVVTNDYHLYRALGTARRFGIDAFGIGAKTNWRIWLAMHIREYVAIVKEAVFQNK